MDESVPPLIFLRSIPQGCRRTHPTHYGHDTADIGDFFVNTMGCGLVLAGIVAACFMDSWKDSMVVKARRSGK